MKTLDTIDWEALRAPFDPEDVDFRLQTSFMKDNKLVGIAIAYMDARLVQDRLDDVVGPENWSFDWQPMATKDNAVIAAKGILTICGVSKSEIGDCDATEKNKASVSDALKRAAVMWGIGRYLYGLGTFYCDVEIHGEKKSLPDRELPKLRAKLRKPKGSITQNTPSATVPETQNTPTNKAKETTEPNYGLIINQFLQEAKVSMLALDMFGARPKHGISRSKPDSTQKLAEAIKDPENVAEIKIIGWISANKHPFTILNVDAFMRQEGIATYVEFAEKMVKHRDDMTNALIELAKQ